MPTATASSPGSIPARLLDAYRHGIFPWFNPGEPILWLTPTGLYTNGVGVDLTDGRSNVRIRILARSDLVAPIAVTVYTDDTNASRLARSLPGQGFAQEQPFTALDFDFACFETVAGTGASFANVGAIVVELSGAEHASLDAQLDSIVAVPEPATLPLMAVGLAGLAVLGRREGRR